jgi:2-dehydro-3-deoxyphosphooctonate aldolase (KDO 8-P synthase)
MDLKEFNIPNVKNYTSANFFLLAGPCVVESEELIFETAKVLIDVTGELEIPFVFKSSYRKANRSKGNSFMGIGDEKALEILGNVSSKLNVAIVSDIHLPEEAALVAKYVDVLQIPAFLCRQTDLLQAAAESGKVVNVKKGQFLSPESMQFVVEKVKGFGNQKVMLTERGTTFGYSDLVVDYRGIPTMQKNNVPVILDVTHSLQQPNQNSGVTGGLPHLIETIAKAGVAVGVDGLFIETHPNPSVALSDGANMLKLSEMKSLMLKLIKLKKAL